MKNLYVLKFIFLTISIFITNSSNACHSITLHRHEAPQTHTTNIDTSGQYFSVLRFDTTYYQYTKMDFSFKGSQLEISFYSEDPCLNEQASTIASFTISNNPASLQWKPNYAFCKVRSMDERPVQFTIALTVKQDITDCSFYKNQFNSIEKPAHAGVLEIGQNCLQVCNKGVKYDHPGNRLVNYQRDKKIKWVEYDIELQTIVSIQNNTDTLTPRCLIYGYRDGDYFLVQDVDLKNQDSTYYQFSQYSSVLLGFYFDYYKEGDFNICLQRYPIVHSCIDFFGAGQGQKLEVVHTSKGSSPQGPYLMGEEVTFSYKVIEWMPINQNWIHGFHIQFGNGWKGLKQNPDSTKYVVNLDNEDIPVDSIPVVEKVGFVTSDTIRFPNFPVKNLKLPGFYVANEGRGPLGPSQNYRWGQMPSSVHGSEENPLAEILFTLVADSTGDCMTPLSASVFVQPLSDYETGIYPVFGCIENTPVEEESTIICCVPLVTVEIPDSTLCDGDIYYFPTGSGYSGTWQITNTPSGYSYNLSQQALTAPLRAINNIGTPDTLYVEVIITDSLGCSNTREVMFIVKPKLSALQININGVCQGEKVNLNEVFAKELGFEVSFEKGNDMSDTKIDKSGDVWLYHEKETSKEYKLSSLQYCTIDSRVDYNPVSCMKPENDLSDISMDVYPNPTLDRSLLTVQNQTDSESWEIILSGSNNQVIWKRYEYIPPGSTFSMTVDMLPYPEGIYFITLRDSQTTLTKRLINIKP